MAVWRFLRGKLRRRSPDTKGSREYIRGLPAAGVDSSLLLVARKDSNDSHSNKVTHYMM
jgi:hypothetical protein